jgi:hypothetical protein
LFAEFNEKSCAPAVFHPCFVIEIVILFSLLSKVFIISVCVTVFDEFWSEVSNFAIVVLHTMCPLVSGHQHIYDPNYENNDFKFMAHIAKFIDTE